MQMCTPLLGKDNRTHTHTYTGVTEIKSQVAFLEFKRCVHTYVTLTMHPFLL